MSSNPQRRVRPCAWLAVSKKATSRSSSAPDSSSARADMYTASAPPTATCELKMTMLTSGRALTFRECLRSGDETQMNRRKSDCAYHTGVTHGTPASSAVPSTM
jgi:hypothetical protein